MNTPLKEDVSIQGKPQFAALDPRGWIPKGELIPLSPRVPALNGKTVYIMNSMPQGTGLEDILEKTADELKSRFPKVEIISANRGANYMRDDPELREEMVNKGDAFIYGSSAASSLTSDSFVFTSKLEQAGLPGVVIAYKTMQSVVISTCERLGAPMRYQIVQNPVTSMTEEENSKTVDDIISALITPLTENEAKSGPYIPEKPPRIAVTGFMEEIQDFFYTNSWTDGLPIIPPTEENVAAMLKGTKHDPDEIVTSEMPPEKLEVTVELVAINGVMAGCLPEYMPVLLAMAEAMVKANIGGTLRSMNSFSFMQVVNGPIRNELNMNSGMYALGPGNRANASIGRAFRLFAICLGGGRVGINIMGGQGNVSCYTFCFAENEEKNPWEPLSVEMGFKKDESTISIFTGGWSHIGNYGSPTPDFDNIASCMSQFEYPNGVVILMAPKKADVLKKNGMNKEDVKEKIWNSATMPLEKFRSGPYFNGLIKSSIEKGMLWPAEYLTLPDDEIVPVYPRKNVHFIVVGGEAVHAMQAWKMAYSTTISIDKWR